MALKTIAWCDGCGEQQFGGIPAFEVTISRRQILPRKDAKADARTLILCGWDCFDGFIAELDKLIAQRIKAKLDPSVKLTFDRKPKAGGRS